MRDFIFAFAARLEHECELQETENHEAQSNNYSN
jgi:hypothetical protein